jgi:CO dehydrogenase/acetyl-CoA synthase alpha subunit
MATMTTTIIHEIDEHNEDLAEEIDLDATNPQVTFYPPLFLQRRMWILDVLRRDSVVDVCDLCCLCVYSNIQF